MNICREKYDNHTCTYVKVLNSNVSKIYSLQTMHICALIKPAFINTVNITHSTANQTMTIILYHPIIAPQIHNHWKCGTGCNHALHAK